MSDIGHQYFTDHFERKCISCGADCANCLDNVGCTACAADSGATDAPGLIDVIANDKQQCAECSVAYSDCALCDGSECTSCIGKQLDTGACTDDCDDGNCRVCNADKATCEHCADGFVLTTGACVAQTCTIENCNDCTSNFAECDVCREGFFLSSSTE